MIGRLRLPSLLGRGRRAAPSPRQAEQSVEALRDSLGDGAGLDPRTRLRMEAAFGQSFAGVRVHTDAEGGALAGRYDAAAVTVGRDVAFAPGRYQPGTPIGDALIAHELAHVAQQGSGSAGLARAEGGWPGAASVTSPAVERDADRSALLAMEGLYARALGAAAAGELGASAGAKAAGWARPQRSLGAAVAPSGCEPSAPRPCEAPCEGPATVDIDSAVRPAAGSGALRLTVSGTTCIQAGVAELYRFEGEDPSRCNFGDALQPPLMVAPVALGCFRLVTPTTLTTVPGIGRAVLVRVVDAADPSNTAVACATVTAR